MAKTYSVTASTKWKGVSWQETYTMEVTAETKADALKVARQKVWNMGHTRQDGALSWKAEPAA